MREQEERAQEIMDTYGHEWMARRIAELEAENKRLLVFTKKVITYLTADGAYSAREILHEARALLGKE